MKAINFLVSYLNTQISFLDFERANKSILFFSLPKEFFFASISYLIKAEKRCTGAGFNIFFDAEIFRSRCFSAFFQAI